jgi:hypothetical protein
VKLPNERQPFSVWSSDYTQGLAVGKVVKDYKDLEADGHDDPSNYLGVFITKIMMGLTIGKGAEETEKDVDSSKLLNSKALNIAASTVKEANYVILPVAMVPGQATTRFRKGENVLIQFADQDVKSMFVLPFKLNEGNMRKTDVLTFYIPSKEKDRKSVV